MVPPLTSLPYLVCRQQRLAKEGEKAAKAAEKAAEDALLKAKQQALEEEQKKKREEERAKREAARKAQEEEKQRRDEERRKRQTEEKERQAELERKRREREEKLKQERREKEERDRKVKEEREAKERAAAAAKRDSRRKRNARRRLVRRRRGLSANVSRRRRPRRRRKLVLLNNLANRTLVPLLHLATLPPLARPNVRHSLRPPQRRSSTSRPRQMWYLLSHISTKLTTSPRHRHQPTDPSNSLANVKPSHTRLFPWRQRSASAAKSSSISSGTVQSCAAVQRVQSWSCNPPAGTGPTLGPSALPRNFGAPGFDSSYPARPIGTPPVISPGPIGPPQKMNSNPPPPSMLAPGSGRRQSIIADPGPIGPPRPIQPIARPNEQSGSGSASPIRRSPSPKVLGSSALAADDDEVVPTSRRTVANGPVWGAAPVPPRSSVDLRGPWGPPPPGFPIQPPNLPRPPVGPSPWGTTSPNDQWHPSNFFPPGQFVGHNPSPPPHSGN
jgi:hypothetical protein